jgi:hypothetical protein
MTDFGIMNMEDIEEYVNPDAPQAFNDIASGMAFMDEQAAAAMTELEAEARKRMALDSDPKDQNYYLRMDKKTVVRTDKEYAACQVAGIPMKVIPYSAAVQALKEQEARERQWVKVKAKKKNAKKARKRNR